jgi:hypothetical protein
LAGNIEDVLARERKFLESAKNIKINTKKDLDDDELAVSEAWARRRGWGEWR